MSILLSAGYRLRTWIVAFTGDDGRRRGGDGHHIGVMESQRRAEHLATDLVRCGGLQVREDTHDGTARSTLPDGDHLGIVASGLTLGSAVHKTIVNDLFVGHEAEAELSVLIAYIE